MRQVHGKHMRAKLTNAALAVLYTLAITLRNGWWWVTRPLLVGVRIVVVRGDDVLLVRHRSGRTPWSLPGGGVGKREPLAQAAWRECYEETGARVQIERLHGVFENFYLGVTNYIAVFIATANDTLEPRDRMEIAEARFFPLDALPPDIEPGSARRITEHCAGQHALHGRW